ncbi:hypothetical protein [Candidatus Cetobacterium colombiensis]|jgi:hypothetical protein|uniref:Uncharacterized protein n=1 Tax=Candidatus Cetobacterium colombiensis TaxID=3073100 RepID=A0ABU4W6H4_9FUSO|nr:hypothetical protein [Candidatus Cetobacterium colombiensis]MDX8335131.1 hypothetical protein [Candidatus Cetobacterium colombiensis]
MSKKIVYIVIGLFLAMNIYARGLKSENNQFSLKDSVITKTQEIFNYENNVSKVKPIDEEQLADVSGKNVSFVINKMR